MGDFSHLKSSGEAAMVDVGEKRPTRRRALAEAEVIVSEACRAKLDETMVREIVSTARIAGIQAAKQTPLLIPLCHHVALSGLEMEVQLQTGGFRVTGEASTIGTTGVEMEALVAVSVAALTIYDMIKAVDPAATIRSARVLRKEGGKGGVWKREG